jgi:signal transduction histidine kinase
LESEEGFGAEPREHVEQILQAGRHLLSLVNEVLDISTAESGIMTLALEPISVDPLITETLSVVASLQNTLKTEVEQASPLGGGWKVLADPQRLKQVLLNLLSNAIKYNRPGGKVIMGFAPIEESDPPLFRFSVHDTGLGIPPEKLPCLFTPFDRLDAERTKAPIPGTGLGLALG